MAEKLQARERDVAMREAAIGQLEQRLNTLRATIDQERGELTAREKAIEDEKGGIQEERNGLSKIKSKLNEDREKFEQEKAKELARLRDLEKNIELERKKEVLVTKVEEQLVRTFEAMDPIAASKALKELAEANQDVAIGLLVAMQPKKVAKLFDQMATDDAKLTAALSEQVGKRKKEVATVRR
jgi:flagellar motility protein MotE (MotC chaperone)